MRLELTGWRAKGLRCPDFEFDFMLDGDEPARVALLQMPNGTGKTTTLRCLRAALTGEARHWPEEEVREFQSRAATNNAGEFELRLRFDESPLTLTMDFDFVEGTVHYSTTFGRGRKPKYDPPVALLRFLEPHFVNLIVFDGELPQALLNPAGTRAEEAIEAFFQLYLLDDVRSAVAGVWERRANEVGATQQAGLTQRRNRRDELRDKVNDLKETQKRAMEEKEHLGREIAILQRRKDEHTGRTEELNAQRKELEDRLAAAEEAVQHSIDRLFSRLSQPHRLAPEVSNSLINLKNHLDRLKLPESTSRRFFEELLEEDECVCGRPIDETARARIESKAEDYLSADSAGVLNALKSDVGRLVENVDDPAAPITELAKEVKDAAHERDTHKTRIKAIAEKLIAAGDEELKGIVDELEAKEKRARQLQEVLEELTRNPRPGDKESDENLCLKYWERKLEKAESDLAEITETVHLREQTQTVAKILVSAKERAVEQLSAAIVEDMNANLERVLEGQHIRVARIDRSLILEGQGGASQGQTLAVGYSFLSTLFGRGRNSLPFVVDAPALALDTRVAGEVGRTIPQICPQFIGFIIDREREGFVGALEDTAGESKMLFVTAFADRPENEELMRDLPDAGTTRVPGGVVVNDRSFFDSVSFENLKEENA